VGIKEQLFRELGSGDRGTPQDVGEQEAEFSGEDNHRPLIVGLDDAASEEIPTRVKTPIVEAAASKSKPKPRSSRAFEVRITTIKGNIEEQLNDAGIVAGEQFGFHTAGMVVVNGSQAFSDALVELARNRPRLLMAMEKTSRGAGFSKILKYGFAIYLAVMVDLETRSPYTFPMKYLGVTEAYETTHPDGGATTAFNGPTFTAPPRFE
jgi:hypothetical protein